MKTAILYSGQTRTLRQVAANHYWHVVRKIANPTIFASVCDDEDADGLDALSEFPSVPVITERVVQPDIPVPEDRGLFHCGVPRQGGGLGVLRQFWHMQRVWDLVGEKARHEDYDVYVRMRPDLAFARCEVHNTPEINECRTPWFGRWGGVNDRFAIMGREAAKVYFSLFQNREKLFADWCPLHPETMLAEYLKRGSIWVNGSLRAEFSLCRKPDEHHAGPWLQPADVSPIDMVDAEV